MKNLKRRVSLLIVVCLLCSVIVCPVFAEDLPGDLNADLAVDTDDVVALLLHLSMPDQFSLYSYADFDGSGALTTDDAIALLLYISMPSQFPLVCDPNHQHQLELVSSTVTCMTSGIRTFICKTCGYTEIQKVAAVGRHKMTSATVAEAASVCAALGNSGLLKYSRMTDVNIDYCSSCGYVQYESARSIYSASEETAIMIEYTQPIRKAYMLETLLAIGYTEDEALADIEKYKHRSDSAAINHAKNRSQAIVNNYSHSGKPGNYAENINKGAQNIQEDFAAWKNSSGHYYNMVHDLYPYFGYARHIVGDSATETITIYSAMLLGYVQR